MNRRGAIGAGIALAIAATSAGAQGYPDRAVKIFQGYAPGGNADTIARLVGNEMSKSLGAPFIVEVRSGAGGTIAASSVAHAKPDGYTLLLATGGHAVADALYAKLGYKSVADFQMISTVTYFPFLIVVRSDSSYRSFVDLLKIAREKPGSLSYGTAGVGSTHHLGGELLSKLAGADLVHVPYRGDSASVTALLGGESPFIIAPPTAVVGNIQAGKLRAIAVTSPQRWPGMPDVPTVAEQGIEGYDVQSWAGLMAPAGTPAPIVERLNMATRQAIAVPDVKRHLEEMGGEARASTPKEMEALVTSEIQKWTKVVSEANIPKQ